MLLSTPAPKVVLESVGTWSHTEPPNDVHNGSFPAGNFFITDIVHTGPHAPVVALPEPAAVLLATGLAALAWRVRRG